MKDFKIALCQMTTVSDKQKNIATARDFIRDAALKFAEIIVLPEMFNCPYDHSLFESFSEEYPQGETIKMLSESASKYGVIIVGGSIPEKDSSGNIYNTSFVFDSYGNLLNKHRKVHLFDIDIPDKITFKESETLSSGHEYTIVETDFCKLGVAICYDIRFPEMFKEMALKGCEVIVVPAAFNMVTGPVHWDLLIRSRALDNQVYLAAVSPARNLESSYIAYGHTSLSDPWGNIIESLDENEGLIVKELSSETISRIRDELPLLKHTKK